MQMTHEVDVDQKSRDFAKRMRRAMKDLGLPLEQLADLTLIPSSRLGELESGRAVFRAAELQLCGVVLGIGIDELFPLPVKDPAAIHEIFVQLTQQGVGLMAATGGGKTESVLPDQEAFERSVVHLHHCAECLGRFPA